MSRIRLTEEGGAVLAMLLLAASDGTQFNLASEKKGMSCFPI